MIRRQGLKLFEKKNGTGSWGYCWPTELVSYIMLSLRMRTNGKKGL